MGSLETVFSSIERSLGFVAKNHRHLIAGFLKVMALTFAIYLACGIIAAAVVFFGIVSFAGGIGAMTIAGIVVSAAIIMPLLIFAGALHLTCFNIVDAAPKGVPIIENGKRMFVPYLVYGLVMAALICGMLLVPLSLMFIAGGGGTTLVILIPLTLIAAILILITAGFFLQFTQLEIAVNGSGGIEAMRSSIALVRGNLAASVVFFIAEIAVGLVVGAVFGVISQLLSFGFFLAMVNVLFLAVVIMLYLALIIVQTLAIMTITLPMQYFFWRAIGGKR
ncbi:MAG: hypothetical protein U0R44_04245 [Candidatus Micrarchaeia archaeon]